MIIISTRSPKNQKNQKLISHILQCSVLESGRSVLLLFIVYKLSLSFLLFSSFIKYKFSLHVLQSKLFTNRRPIFGKLQIVTFSLITNYIFLFIRLKKFKSFPCAFFSFSPLKLLLSIIIVSILLILFFLSIRSINFSLRGNISSTQDEKLLCYFIFLMGNQLHLSHKLN